MAIAKERGCGYARQRIAGACPQTPLERCASHTIYNRDICNPPFLQAGYGPGWACNIYTCRPGGSIILLVRPSAHAQRSDTTEPHPYYRLLALPTYIIAERIRARELIRVHISANAYVRTLCTLCHAIRIPSRTFRNVICRATTTPSAIARGINAHAHS